MALLALQRSETILSSMAVQTILIGPYHEMLRDDARAAVPAIRVAIQQLKGMDE